MRPDILIRKYTDRRLYDTGASRYVKLKDIARFVREGSDVRVVDARTGKDLTTVILTQIVVEDARKAAALPVNFLRQLVRASDRATHEFLSSYLGGTLDVYQKAQQRVRSGLEEAKTAATSPLEFMRNLLAGQASPPAAPPGGAAARGETAGNGGRRRAGRGKAGVGKVARATSATREAETLRRRVEELEARLAQIEQPAQRARRAAKRKPGG
ncbi:MAG TPA: polyhydroxyalkanoate synthesis regulator DNA-binding domain-containing protein [Terriglobia bacterium]|nr:polyhydroxyalkanoate synthesis regulator DNA-binding domain-containing protein [Terriglobia bacterium]